MGIFIRPEQFLGAKDGATVDLARCECGHQPVLRRFADAGAVVHCKNCMASYQDDDEWDVAVMKWNRLNMSDAEIVRQAAIILEAAGGKL